MLTGCLCVQVEFSVEKSTFHLLVDGVRVTDGLLPNNEGSSLELRNPVYLGGDPISRNTNVCINSRVTYFPTFACVHIDPLLVLPQGHNVPMDSVIGCVRDFKMNEEVIEGPKASSKTLPCSDQLTEMGTYFGGGHIILGLAVYIDPNASFHVPVYCVWVQITANTDLKPHETSCLFVDNYFNVGSQFVLAFEFRPQHLTGLFFHVRGHKTRLDVFLMETKVNLSGNLKLCFVICCLVL